MFLTDGLPTDGIEDEQQLAQIASKLNSDKGAKFFSFGVGYDVNGRLLDRLSGQAKGFTTFVNPGENIEEKVSSFFSKRSSPALVDPKLNISVKTNRLIPSSLPDIFLGSQTVVVGRYPKGGEALFTISGQEAENEVVHSYQVELADGPTENGDFISQIWAQRRIGELIDQIDLKGSNKELIDELLNLSKRYGIMTPYTSFLALDNQSLGNSAELKRKIEDRLDNLSEVTGASANYQRDQKQLYKVADAAPSAKSDEVLQYELEEMASFGGEAASPDQGVLVAPVNLAGRGFFHKEGNLIEGTLTEEDLKKVIVIEQFSPEYYQLATELNPGQQVWLAQSKPIIFNFHGANYRIEVPDKTGPQN
jgi:Ca-activated chloride channel family protein